MKRFFLSLVAALALGGCGASPPTRTSPPKPAVAEETAKIDIRAFAFSEPGLMAYLKARELADLPGYADWLEVHPEAQRVNALFEQLRAGCALDPFQVVDEVLFTLVRERLIGAVRVRLGEEKVFLCLENLVDGGTRTVIADRPSLRAPDGSMVMTLVDDILVFGDEATVADRIRSHTAYDGRISAALPDLRNIVAYARVGGEDGTVEAIESRFSRTSGRLELSVRLTSPSPEDADWVVTALRGALDGEVSALVGELPEAARPRATKVLDQAQIQRRIGQSVEITLPVSVLAESQILLVALVDRLGEAMVRRQHLEEARMVLEVLAMRMAGHAEAHPQAGRAAFIASAPLTPSGLPGPDDDSGPADWSHPTWRTLGFEPPMALPHAYEIETARDGRSAVIRAVGDLDGDGEPSILEVALAVKDGAITIGEVTTRGDPE
jgi:hypothetical protein